MKAKLKGTISSMSRNGDSGYVTVMFTANGAVENSKSPDAKQAQYSGVLSLKALIANELKFGQELFVTVSTEEGA